MNLPDQRTVQERLEIAALNPVPNPNAQLLRDARETIKSLADELGRARRTIRADHALKAELGGGSCVCEYCREDT